MAKTLEAILGSFGMERRINYDLTRFKAALKSAGNPERTAQTLIVSGTNGKGGTTLFLSSGLVHHGYRVGTYLSPHLQGVQERFLCNLVPIAEPDLFRLAKTWEKKGHEYQLSYFEFLTLLFFAWCEEQAFDYVVLEVGLGGRLDATNVTEPKACALTNISWDHQSYLGNTLSEILREKLGIVPPGGVLFTSLKDSELLSELHIYCKERGAQVLETSALKVQARQVDWAGQTFTLEENRFALSNPSLGYQENAVLAYQLLRTQFPQIPVSTLQEAFFATRFPGRFETIAEKPRVILSGDHNLDGIRSLKETLSSLRVNNLTILCAFSPDKPFKEMYGELNTLTKRLTLTQIQNLRQTLPAEYFTFAPVAPHAPTATTELLSQMQPDETLLITGSLYLIGEVRSFWRKNVAFLETPARALPNLDFAPDEPRRAILHVKEVAQNPDLPVGDAAP